MTSDTAHRRSAEFATRRTANVDRDNAWKLARIDKFDTLSGADEREREENRREAIHDFLE